MAVLAACADGNLTSSSTWELVDSTSYSNSESANSAVTTSVVASSTFTPGAITVDGVAVKIASRAASPTGTFTIELFNSTGSASVDSVTVNVSDVPTATATSGTTSPVETAQGGWFFVKFGSSHLLLAATAYSVRLSTSSNSQVNVWSASGTNWSRYLRTTTTQAPTTGDDMIVTGEWTAAATVTARTVTMNSTSATDYGSNTTSQVTPALAVCNNGTLACETSASTTYILQLSGYAVIYNGGTFTFGTNGTPVPSTSTATLQFDCGTTGDFGLVARNGSTVNFYGSGRTNGNNTVITFLTADAAVSATALTVNDSTGWKNTDSICYAPTGTTSTQFEKKALTADASGTSLTSTALTNAHSGTSPTQAEVGLLTHNVVFTQVTSTKCTFLFCGGSATVALYQTEFSATGVNATGKYPVEVATTSAGSFLIDHCSIHDTVIGGVRMNSGVTTSLANITVQYTVFYNVGNSGFFNNNNNNATPGTWTVDHCMFCGTTSSSNVISLSSGAIGTFTNNSVSGCAAFNAAVYCPNVSTFATFSGNTIHSNSGTSFSTGAPFYGTLSTTKVYHNTGNFTISGGQRSTNDAATDLTIIGCDFFGNNSVGLFLNYGQPVNCSVILDSCTFNSTSTQTQASCVAWNVPGIITMYSCELSGTATGKTVCTNNFDAQNSRNPLTIIADNCILASTNMINSGNFSNFFPSNIPLLLAQNFGQTANDNRCYVYTGSGSAFNIVQSDSGTVHGTDTLSEKMTPGTASFKTRTAPKYVAAKSGLTNTFSIYVQKDGSYSGNAPRLILLRQDSMGITSDTVCATFSAGASTWQQLSYTTPTAPQDGVWAFVVDCDGTAGSIFVGDASA